MHKFITTTVNLSDTLMITQQTNKRPFNDLFLRTTWVNQYQKQNTTLDSNAARDDGVSRWQWHITGPYANNLQFIPDREIQITTPTPSKQLLNIQILHNNVNNMQMITTVT